MSIEGATKVDAEMKGDRTSTVAAQEQVLDQPSSSAYRWFTRPFFDEDTTEVDSWGVWFFDPWENDILPVVRANLPRRVAQRIAERHNAILDRALERLEEQR